MTASTRLSRQGGDRFPNLSYLAVGSLPAPEICQCLPFLSEHFNQYFALTEGNRVAFSPNTERIREAHKSLLATLMLELALEDSTYPVDVLMACLGDVVADAPRAKHREYTANKP